jgi:indoleamine 2,3-dioxygenase
MDMIIEDEMTQFSKQNKKNTLFDLSNGFLPNKDPIINLPGEYHEIESLAIDLPKLLSSDQTRKILDNLTFVSIENLNMRSQYERLMMLLSYLGHAYIWNNENPLGILPKNLSQMWYEVAKKVGRPPVLSYASYALYNYKKIDPNDEIKLGNIALLQNFLGGIDEEWFILIHVAIEKEAALVVEALSNLRNHLIKNDNLEIVFISEEIKKVNTALVKINEIMERMPEYCDPYIYYNRVRPYIHGWKDNPALPNGVIYQGVSAYGERGQFFKGETGAQSSIIPSLDALYKIYHKDTPLKAHLDEMRFYMPPEHQSFIQSLEETPSLRAIVIENKESLKDSYSVSH